MSFFAQNAQCLFFNLFKMQMSQLHYSDLSGVWFIIPIPSNYTELLAFLHLIFSCVCILFHFCLCACCFFWLECFLLGKIPLCNSEFAWSNDLTFAWTNPLLIFLLTLLGLKSFFGFCSIVLACCSLHFICVVRVQIPRLLKITLKLNWSPPYHN